MPDWDDFGISAEGGPRWLNRIFGALGILVGAGIGAWLGWTSSGFVQATGGFLVGGFVGWGAGVLLSGFLFFVFIFLIVLAGVFGWQWLTGGFG